MTGPTPLSPDAPEPPPLTVVSDRVGDHWRHNPDPDDPGPWQCIGGAPDPGDSVAGEARSWAELRKEGPLTVVSTPGATRAMPDRYVVIGEYLVEDTGNCTCGVEDTGASAGAPGPYQHEQYCGLEPVAKISDIVAWVEANARLGIPAMAARADIPEPPDGATVRDRDGHTWRRDDNATAFNGFPWVCPVKGVTASWEHVLTLGPLDTGTSTRAHATPAPTPARQIQWVTANPGVIDHERVRTEALAAEWAADDEEHAIRQIPRVEPPGPEDDDDWDPDEDHPR